MASELVERTADAPSVALIGIQRRGVELAERLAPLLEAQLHRPLLRGSLGITLYRDDLQAIGQRPVVHERGCRRPTTVPPS
jgi:pyrimidine operon attenuation protein/uracil phosphoribosyltransferase